MAVKKESVAETTTKDVAVQPISRVDLAALQTFDQAVGLAEQAYGEIISAEALGDGFAVTDKRLLVGKPMLILSWEDGKNVKFKGNGFTIVRAITKENDKVLFVDGSTGIRDQLTVFQQVSGRTGGLLAEHGLRVSEYEYTEEDGTVTPAKTYYIAENANVR